MTFCHATLRTDDEIVTRITPDDEVVAAFPGGGAVVVGHTHIQFDKRYDGLRLVTPEQSAYRTRVSAAPSWAMLADGAIDLRRTGYDVDAAAEAIRGSDWSEAGQLAKWLTEPEHPEQVTKTFEQRRRDA